MKALSGTPVKRLLLVQLSVSALTSVVGLGFGLVAAYSALLGGLVSTAAHAYSGWRTFSGRARGSEYAELANLYRAEFGKLLTFAALTAAVFAGVKDVHIVAFIGGCVTTMIAGAVSLATMPVNATTPRGRMNKQSG